MSLMAREYDHLSCRLCIQVPSAQPTTEEAAALRERAERLASLTAEEGAPIGGAANGGKYVFPLLPGNWQELGTALLPALLTSIPAYLDAEDPTRSSWCRFINHAEDDASANLKFQVDCIRGFVWFVASRPIGAGEELAFKYDEDRKLSAEENANSWFSNVSVDDVLRGLG